jgi:hypothetical protein
MCGDQHPIDSWLFELDLHRKTLYTPALKMQAGQAGRHKKRSALLFVA